MAFVLDASSTLPWCFADEATVESEKLLSRAEAGELIYVPGHWPLEVLSAVTKAIRRKRISEADADRFLERLTWLQIVVDQSDIEAQWTEARRLTTRHQLTGYDAGYLALALRMKVGLATQDARLAVAAAAERVELV